MTTRQSAPLVESRRCQTEEKCCRSTLLELCARQHLGFPVWGMAPGQDPDEVRGYKMFGCTPLATQETKVVETAVTPYASALALPFTPGAGYANLVELRRRYPGCYRTGGSSTRSTRPPVRSPAGTWRSARRPC